MSSNTALDDTCVDLRRADARIRDDSYYSRSSINLAMNTEETLC